MIDKVNNRMRKLMDNCDDIKGFVVLVNDSIGGGTGSGLGALETICQKNLNTKTPSCGRLNRLIAKFIPSMTASM